MGATHSEAHSSTQPRVCSQDPCSSHGLLPRCHGKVKVSHTGIACLIGLNAELLKTLFSEVLFIDGAGYTEGLM